MAALATACTGRQRPIAAVPTGLASAQRPFISSSGAARISAVSGLDAASTAVRRAAIAAVLSLGP